MDQPEDHLWILRGTDADLERLLLVLSLGPQYVSTVFQGAKGLVEMWRNLEQNRPWVNVWLMFRHFSLKLLWVLDTLVLFASDMWSCEMFFGRQWKHHSIQNMPPLFLPKKTPCFGSFRTRVDFPEVYHSLLFPKEKPILTTRFPTILGLSTGADLASETTKEKTLNAHEATVTSLSASPPTAPYDPRLVSCSKARNNNCMDIKSGYGGVWRFELCQLYCTKLTNQVFESVLVLMKNVYHTHYFLVNVWNHIRK